jgi:hypothetical protein
VLEFNGKKEFLAYLLKGGDWRVIDFYIGLTFPLEYQDKKERHM